MKYILVTVSLECKYDEEFVDLKSALSFANT